MPGTRHKRWMGRALATLPGLLLASCSLAGAPERASVIEAGRPFELRAGEEAVSTDGRWRLGFISVSSDSRCPRGVQCIWAGDATVQMWLQARGGSRTPLTLHAALGAAQSAVLMGQELRLLQLAPETQASRVLAPDDYVVTLVLRPASGAASRAEPRTTPGTTPGTVTER